MSNVHMGLCACSLALATIFFATSPASAAPLGVYDGNGALLGTFGGHDSQSVVFVSPKGYVTRVRVDDEASSEPNGMIEGVLDSASTYNSSDCTGSALTSDPVTGRMVWITGATDQLGYVATDAVPLTLAAGTIISRRSYDGGCSSSTLARDTTFVPALPNDPPVTGVHEGVVPLPIRIAFVDGVFADGFDARV
jgi:hypothetical protein